MITAPAACDLCGMKAAPAILAIAVCLAAAPASAEIRRRVAVDYAKFGACAYQALERAYPGAIRYADLRGADTIQINHTAQSAGWLFTIDLSAFSMEIRKAGKGADVLIKSKGSLLGPDSQGEDAWKEIAPCAGA